MLHRLVAYINGVQDFFVGIRDVDFAILLRHRLNKNRISRGRKIDSHKLLFSTFSSNLNIDLQKNVFNFPITSTDHMCLRAKHHY